MQSQQIDCAVLGKRIAALVLHNHEPYEGFNVSSEELADLIADLLMEAITEILNDGVVVGVLRGPRAW